MFFFLHSHITTWFYLCFAQYMERFTATKKKFAWSVRGFLLLSSVLGLVRRGFSFDRTYKWQDSNGKKVRTASQRRPAAHHRYSTESTCMNFSTNRASLFLLQRFYKRKHNADCFMRTFTLENGLLYIWGH